MSSSPAGLRERLERAGRVHVDARVIAYHLVAHARYIDLTRLLFAALRDGDVAGQSSTLTLYQLLAEAHRRGAGERAEEVVRRLMVLPGLEWVPVSEDIAARAAEVMARLGGRLERAVQVATGLASGADVYLTQGSGLKRIADMRVVNLDAYTG